MGFGAGTLLGPEGPDADLSGSGLNLWTSFCLSLLGAGGWGFRPYFENYTVDASILQLIFGLVAQDDLKDH